jgi:membrane protease YdiL (CAAX protease family)
MMERARVLLVASATAPIRVLARRLQDPDIDLIICSTAKEALERIGPPLPNVVVVDGSLPGREIFRLYGRMRASAPGATIPIIFTNHVSTGSEPPATTNPDFYLAPTASIDDVEQLIFTFFPDSLVEEEPLPEPEPPPPPRGQQRPTRRPPAKPREPPQILAELTARLRSGAATLPLIYLAVYLAGEVLAATVAPWLGMVVHAGLLLTFLLHGANLPPGPERAFYWTLCLAPLMRFYGLAQPYAGAPAITWWAVTAIPTAVAAGVAMRAVGLASDDVGLKPSMRETPVAILMVPIGLTIGVLQFLVLEPHPVARDIPFGGVGLAALILILNPGIVEEVVFRGVLQRGAGAGLGPVLGILYVSLLYSAFGPAGLPNGPTLLSVTITFMTGLMFAIVTARTGSILSATVAHIGLALSFYLIAPALMLNATSTPAPPPLVLPTASPQATVRPVVTVGSAPTTAPAPAGPGPAQTAPTAPAGQGSPAAAPTPITLAPPLVSPPSAATPAGAPVATSPQPSTEGSNAATGQIVVVRGTGASGARLRGQPGNNGQVLAVIPEYTPLVVVGPDRNVDGIVWRNVRAPNGSEGWIAASFVTTGQP